MIPVEEPITISISAVRQPSFFRQIVEVLLFQSATDGLPRYLVRAFDAAGTKWFTFRVQSREEAIEKKQRLEMELQEMGASAFLQRYGQR